MMPLSRLCRLLVHNRAGLTDILVPASASRQQFHQRLLSTSSERGESTSKPKPKPWAREMGITRPTLLLDQRKMLSNLERMLDKANDAGAELIPHFKTHQSQDIAQIFSAFGV